MSDTLDLSLRQFIEAWRAMCADAPDAVALSGDGIEADAAMRHALDLAARTHGHRPTVLHATAAGRPVYERMGYEAISSHTIFMERRFLEGH